MPRVFVDQDLDVDCQLRITRQPGRHLVQVLRVQPGAAVTVFNGRGGEYHGHVVGLDRHGVTVVLDQYADVERESPLATTLVQGVSRSERMDFTIQKAVELGVRRIVPILTERSVVKLSGERADRRLAHWRGVAAAAAEQCGRNRLAEIGEIMRFDRWLETGSTSPGWWLQAGASQSLAAQAVPADGVMLVIGPEGGFAPHEHAALGAAGHLPVSLGPRILRTETAALVALAILQSRNGDLG